MFDGAAQLLPAIAFERPEQIAGEAFRMEPGQHRAGRGRVVDRDGEVLGPAVSRAEGENARSLGALERHFRRGDLLQPVRGGDIVGHDRGRSDPEQVRLFGSERAAARSLTSAVTVAGRSRAILASRTAAMTPAGHRIAPRLERAAQGLGEVGRRIREACQPLDREPLRHRNPDHVRRVETDFQGGGPVMGNRQVRFPPRQPAQRVEPRCRDEFGRERDDAAGVPGLGKNHRQTAAKIAGRAVHRGNIACLESWHGLGWRGTHGT